MRDAMRGYLHAASGLTELTRKRAQDLAQSLLASSGAGSGGAAVAQQVAGLAEELVAAARSNRSAVREMIRGEVEIAVAHLGLVPATELAEARQQIAALESAVAELRHGQQGSSAPTASAPAKTRPSRSAVKRAAVAPTTAAPKKATAKKATAKKATAKKATAKKATAKKATAKKATAKKATS